MNGVLFKIPKMSVFVSLWPKISQNRYNGVPLMLALFPSNFYKNSLNHNCTRFHPSTQNQRMCLFSKSQKMFTFEYFWFKWPNIRS